MNTQIPNNIYLGLVFLVTSCGPIGSVDYDSRASATASSLVNALSQCMDKPNIVPLHDENLDESDDYYTACGVNGSTKLEFKGISMYSNQVCLIPGSLNSSSQFTPLISLTNVAEFHYVCGTASVSVKSIEMSYKAFEDYTALIVVPVNYVGQMMAYLKNQIPVAPPFSRGSIGQ